MVFVCEEICTRQNYQVKKQSYQSLVAPPQLYPSPPPELQGAGEGVGAGVGAGLGE